MHGRSQTGSLADPESTKGHSSFGIKVLQHAVSATPFGIAFLLFCGNGYYARLFREFGVKPSILEISQLDIATMGFYSVCYAWYTIIRDNAWLWIKSAAIGFGIAIAIVAILVFVPRLMSLCEPLVPIANRIDRFNRRCFRWILAFLFLIGGLGGGDLAGAYDARSIQEHRKGPENCYIVDGVPYRSVVLAQDKSRTILVHPDRTSIVGNDRLSFVASCVLFKRERVTLSKAKL